MAAGFRRFPGSIPTFDEINMAVERPVSPMLLTAHRPQRADRESPGHERGGGNRQQDFEHDD